MPSTGRSSFCASAVQEDCIETIALELEEYERLRSHSKLFVVTPGHETLAVERVVDQGDFYLLVEKTVGVEEVTAADPRSTVA